MSLLLGGGADDDCPHRHSLVKLILKQVQHQELTAEELERLKYWDDIWEFFEKQPETLETLQGIYALYSNPDYQFIEFEADTTAKALSPFNRLFADRLSLREVIAIAYSFVKSKFVEEPEAKTQIKGVAKDDKQSATTFDVQLATQEIGKIGFKRKKITNFIISIFYLSGGKVIPLFLLCLGLIGLSFILIINSPYRLARLQTFLNPDQELETTSYHNSQIILSLSSGGFFGKGFANSDQKYRFLPKISTDSILAIIGEETGFLGTFTLILIYILLLTYLIKLASLVHQDTFSSLLVAGIACWIGYQGLINISAIANIIPLTGVPLPFVSYGGSSLLTLMTAIGLVRNVEKNHSLLLYSDNDQTKKNHYHHRHSSHSRSRTNPTTPVRSKN